MDLGLAEFGDAEIAKKLVREIGTGTLLGKILGEGAAITARILNHSEHRGKRAEHCGPRTAGLKRHVHHLCYFSYGC